MRTSLSLFLFAMWFLSSLSSDAIPYANRLQSFPEDTSQLKKEQFKKEYKAKLSILEAKIAETRERIKKEKQEAQEKMNKELDSLEESKKGISSRLEESGTKSQSDWEKFETEIREEYDETESKVRNFFKR